MTKRKLDSSTDTDTDAPTKRVRMQPRGVTPEEQLEEPRMDVDSNSALEHTVSRETGQPKRKTSTTEHNGRENSVRKVRKLVPPRPFPTVPTSVSATGPRSAHKEGKNHICITRRTELGAYLRRCKELFLKDGCVVTVKEAAQAFTCAHLRYKTLHLSAMGAAIPHLMQLALSLPPILPYPQDEISTEILTGTVEVQDELIPEDDDEDISYQTRGKSTVSVVIKVGDGVDEPAAGAAEGGGRKNNVGRGKGRGGARSGRKDQAQVPEQIIFREDELDE